MDSNHDYDRIKRQKEKTMEEIEKLQQDIQRDIGGSDLSIPEKEASQAPKLEEQMTAGRSEEIAPQTFKAPEEPLDPFKNSDSTDAFDPMAETAPATEGSVEPIDQKTMESPIEVTHESINTLPTYAKNQALPPDHPFDTHPYIHENIKPRHIQRRTFKETLALVAVASILGGAFIGAGFSLGNAFLPGNEQGAEGTNNPLDIGDGNPVLSDNKETSSIDFHNNTFSRAGFADLIEEVDPFVVSILARKSSNPDTLFAFPYAQEGSSGSGILFDENDDLYYIVTNSHVISGAQSVTVSIANASPIEAKLIGKNEEADLAVISILKKDLKDVGVLQVKLATFGDSDSMRVGDFVLAIGNSMGEGNTATNGMISAKDKIIHTDQAELEVLQTNAAINPGNSGGPLINLDGEVIGITTAKMADVLPAVSGNFTLEEPSTTIEGMGYAIPSNIAREIIDELMNGEEKAALGVGIYNMTEEFAKQYNLPQAGALVNSVEENSAADIAGIQKMDVITGFNDISIMNPEQLVEAVGNCEVGEKVDIKIISADGKMKTVTAILQAAHKDAF